MFNAGDIIIIVLLFITYVCGCTQGHKDIHGDTPCIEGVHNITLPTAKSFDVYHSYYYHYHCHHYHHYYHRIVRLLCTCEHSFFAVPIPKWKIVQYLCSCTAFRLYINGNMENLKLKRYTELWIIHVDRRAV